MTDPTDDTLRCRRCGRVRAADDVDRLIWCEDCQAAERRRARSWGRFLALGGTALLALWIALAIGPSREFLVLWAAVIVVAYYLGTRLGVELAYGVIRVRNSPGARLGSVEEDAGG